jgi:N-acyl-D-amino-acid deacylase
MSAAIRGGRVIDPLHGVDVVCDVLIDDGRIVAVGVDLDTPTDAVEVDATGLLVVPGFIDIHSHTDFTTFRRPAAEARLRQGITTDVTGNCGFSPFPLAPENAWYGSFLDPDLQIRWQDLATFRDDLTEVGHTVNLAPLVGLGAVRLEVVGQRSGPATDAEIEKMQQLVETAMAQGAFGASTGLVYMPGANAEPDEIEQLLRPVHEAGRLYSSHIRNERSCVVEAVQEAISTATNAGVRLQLSHHKALGRENWGLTEQTLALVDAANARGDIEVRVDIYPYTAGATELKSLLPADALTGGIEKFRARITDPAYREEVLRKVDESGQYQPAEVILDASTSRPELSGKSLVEAAQSVGMTPAELVVDLVVAEGETLTIIGHAASDDDLRRVVRHEHSMHGSDAWLMDVDQAEYSHPRNFHSGLRYLSYASNDETLSMSDAVDRLSNRPARQLGILDRGHLGVGASADVVIIDPERLTMDTRYGEPCHYPDAVRYVYVNGEAVIIDGVQTDARPGLVLSAAGQSSGTGSERDVASR